jgi:hypothetical protein
LRGSQTSCGGASKVPSRLPRASPRSRATLRLHDLPVSAWASVVECDPIHRIFEPHLLRRSGARSL